MDVASGDAAPEQRAATLNCLIDAWAAHETELRSWLRGRLRGDPEEVDDLLQSIFLKAMRQDRRFCEITNPRAWFFTVARNALTDRLRLRRELTALPDDLPHAEPEAAPVIHGLAACLPRALAELGDADCDALTRCDLEGMSQAEYARLQGLSLPAAKSRLQRARKKLGEHLTRACQVRFDEAGQVCCFVPRSPVE